MDFTFKKKQQHHSLPFLERFKHKISKVDKITGLIGVLGLQIKQKEVSEDIKKRVNTQGNAYKGNPRFKQSKIGSEVSYLTRYQSVEVNHFSPLDDDQKGKENIDINSPKHDKEQLKYRKVAKSDEIDLQKKNQELRKLILPKIGSSSTSVPEVSRIREKMKKKYDKFRLLNVNRKDQQKGTSLRH